MHISTEIEINSIIEELWKTNPEDKTPTVYAILDGARDRRIEPLINNSQLEQACLYEGKLTYELKRSAPHIIKLEKDNAITRKIIKLGWGNSWGIFATTYNTSNLSAIKLNCKKIAFVHDENNRKLLFRYYDPRISRVYLPTCNESEANQVFGSVIEYIVENENPTKIHRFTRTHSGVIDLNNINIKNQEKLVQGNFKIQNKNFLIIRSEQMDILSTHAQEKEYQSLKKQFINDFIYNPKEKIEFKGEKYEIDSLLRHCLKEAVKFKLEDRYSIYSFFHLNYQYGWGFWNTKNHAWTKSILESARDGDIKIEKIENKFSSNLMDQLWN